MPPSASQKDKGQMLFLIGHGLQTPLSAIRWGCNRLSKMGRDNMTSDQLHVLDSIRREAKMLSGMLNTLLLVARVEDGTYAGRDQDIYLRDFLVSFPPLQELFSGEAPSIACPKNLLLHMDRGILEAIFQAIAVIMSTAAPPRPGLRLGITEGPDGCEVSIHPPIELSLLRQLPALEENAEMSHMVGGAPGLMLSIVRSLCEFVGGELHVRKHGQRQHTLGLRLPLTQNASSEALISSR